MSLTTSIYASYMGTYFFFVAIGVVSVKYQYSSRYFYICIIAFTIKCLEVVTNIGSQLV